MANLALVSVLVAFVGMVFAQDEACRALPGRCQPETQRCRSGYQPGLCSTEGTSCCPKPPRHHGPRPGPGGWPELTDDSACLNLGGTCIDRAETCAGELIPGRLCMLRRRCCRI